MGRSTTTFVIIASAAIGPITGTSILGAQDVLFKRGDINFDDRFNITDVVNIAQRLFVVEEEFTCEDSADVNDDGRLNVTDVIQAANYLFLDGNVPPPPLVDCGADLTDDALACDEFPPCGIDLDVCLDEGLVDELFADVELGLGLEICLPAGLLQIPVEIFEVSVCPEEAAQPECGDLGQPGCPIEITSIEPILDLETEEIGFHVTGRIVDLPIDVTESLFGTTTCLNTFHAADDPEAPFTFDIVVPLIVEEVKPGVREVVGLGEGVVDNVDMALDSSGGLVCTLFGALEDVLIDLFLQPLGEALGGISEQLADGLAGLRICED